MATLTLDERERIVDSALKIQSVRNSLKRVGKNKIPSMTEITDCLKNVDKSLRAALGYVRGLGPDSSKAEYKKASTLLREPAKKQP
jgi:hypothetical protein